MIRTISNANLRYTDAEGALLGQFRHFYTDVYGNRGKFGRFSEVIRFARSNQASTSDTHTSVTFHGVSIPNI